MSFARDPFEIPCAATRNDVSCTGVVRFQKVKQDTVCDSCGIRYSRDGHVVTCYAWVDMSRTTATITVSDTTPPEVTP